MKISEKLVKFIEESGKDGKVELTGEFKDKINELFGLAVKEKEGEITTLEESLSKSEEQVETLQGEITTLKESTLEQVKEEVESHKEGLVDKLSSFLDEELKELIPDSIVEAAAKVEIYEPLVESMKSAFAEKGIEIGSEGHEVLKEARDEIVTLRDDVNTKTVAYNELSEKSEQLLARYVLNEKCEGLTVEQKDKVCTIFKNDSVEEINEKFDSVRDLVVEDVGTDGDGDLDEKRKTTVVNDDGVQGGKDLNEENDLGQDYLGKLEG